MTTAERGFDGEAAGQRIRQAYAEVATFGAVHVAQPAGAAVFIAIVFTTK